MLCDSLRLGHCPLAEALNFFNNQIGDEGLVHVASLLKVRHRAPCSLPAACARAVLRMPHHGAWGCARVVCPWPLLVPLPSQEREARRALERQRHELRFEQARIEERLVDHALEARIAQLKGRPAVLDIGGAAKEARVGTPKWWADIEKTAAGKERWSDAAAGDLEQLRLVREEAARLERRRPAPPILPRLAKVRVGRNGISHKEMQAFKALCGRLGITCEA